MFGIKILRIRKPNALHGYKKYNTVNLLAEKWPVKCFVILFKLPPLHFFFAQNIFFKKKSVRMIMSIISSILWILMYAFAFHIIFHGKTTLLFNNTIYNYIDSMHLPIYTKQQKLHPARVEIKCNNGSC